MDISDGLCPFQSGLTIAAICNYFWRAKILKQNTICLVPPAGQGSGRKRSLLATKWLRYMETKDNVIIDAEARVGRFTVDGRARETAVCYEFLGCMWHGCLKCSDRDTIHPFFNSPMHEVNRKTNERLAELRTITPRVKFIWEHQVNADAEFTEFAKSLSIVDPLNPRDVSVRSCSSKHSLIFSIYSENSLFMGEERMH